MNELIHWEITERIIEYPFLFRHLNPLDNSNIVDVGAVESELSIKLATLGHKVTALDNRKYPHSHENLISLSVDLVKYINFPKNFYDWGVCISTLEHIGIGFNQYGDPPYSNKDEIDVLIMNKIYDMLKDAGKLILTIPFGKSNYTQHFHKFKIYDLNDVNRLLSKFKILVAEYWYLDKWDGLKPIDYYQVSPEELTEKSDLSFYPTKGVACFYLEKI